MAVTVRIEENEAGKNRYRAIAGTRKSVGRTAGEALDFLLASEGPNIESSSILIQRFVPDTFFTQAQFDRMQDLLARRTSLTQAENAELDALLDAELDATVARTDGMLVLSQS